MNLNAYDVLEVNTTVGSWYNPMYKTIYTTEFKKYSKFGFLKRYNAKARGYDYFIVVFDDLNSKIKSHPFVRNSRGVSKLSLKSDIIIELGLDVHKQLVQLHISLFETQDDCDIYQLDF